MSFPSMSADWFSKSADTPGCAGGSWGNKSHRSHRKIVSKKCNSNQPELDSPAARCHRLYHIPTPGTFGWICEKKIRHSPLHFNTAIQEVEGLPFNKKSLKPGCIMYSPENYRKLTCPLKNDGWKTIFLLKWSPFRGYVSFTECNGLCATRSRR